MRSDLYDPAFWFLLIFSLWLVTKRKFVISSIIWGIGIFTQVWFWLFTPFWIVFLFRTKDSIQAALLSGLSVGIGLIGLGLFILPDPAAYYEHVFSFYREMHRIGHYPVTTMSVSAIF